jgi:hypothetical protein
MSMSRVVAAAMMISLASNAALAQAQMGAWRYASVGNGFQATVSSGKASFGFRCDRQAALSIYGVFVPGEPLGMPRNGELKRGLSVQVDNAPALNNDWFYPDETKGETEVQRSPGIDSFDVLAAVRKGAKTLKVRTTKSDAKPLEFSFDIRGAKEALNKLVADCKSSEYR